MEGLFKPSHVDAHLQAEICARIKLARKEAGFTQEDMAALLDVTQRAYQNYERNRVPFRRLSDIARLTKRTEDWLLHGDPQPTVTTDALALLLERVEGLEEALAELLLLVQSLPRASVESEPG